MRRRPWGCEARSTASRFFALSGRPSSVSATASIPSSSRLPVGRRVGQQFLQRPGRGRKSAAVELDRRQRPHRLAGDGRVAVALAEAGQLVEAAVGGRPLELRLGLGVVESAVLGQPLRPHRPEQAGRLDVQRHVEVLPLPEEPAVFGLDEPLEELDRPGVVLLLDGGLGAVDRLEIVELRPDERRIGLGRLGLARRTADAHDPQDLRRRRPGDGQTGGKDGESNGQATQRNRAPSAAARTEPGRPGRTLCSNPSFGHRFRQ